MGKAYKAPTFHVTAITMRRRSDRLQPGIFQDVNIPFCTTDWGGCIIQVKKRNKIEEGWQRNFLSAILSTSQGMRLAIAVDVDVDIYCMDATLPYGYESDFARPVYPVDRVDLSRWFSAAQLERGRAMMNGWVEVLARTGR
jgi:gallate decarboxylase subunit C